MRSRDIFPIERKSSQKKLTYAGISQSKARLGSTGRLISDTESKLQTSATNAKRSELSAKKIPRKPTVQTTPTIQKTKYASKQNPKLSLNSTNKIPESSQNLDTPTPKPQPKLSDSNPWNYTLDAPQNPSTVGSLGSYFNPSKPPPKKRSIKNLSPHCQPQPQPQNSCFAQFMLSRTPNPTPDPSFPPTPRNTLTPSDHKSTIQSL